MQIKSKVQQKEYLASIMDLLQEHGPVRSKPMFGGYGIYYKDIMIGGIMQNKLFFRTDEVTRKAYEQLKAEPYIHVTKKGTVVMPYMTVPVSVLENKTELPLWMEQAFEIAGRSKKKKI